MKEGNLAGTIALGVMLGLLCQDEQELARSKLPGIFAWPLNLRDSLKFWVPPIVIQCCAGSPSLPSTSLPVTY